ncbi:hypothetical protein RB597_007772 [Gaeumannomyces tritici]
MDETRSRHNPLGTEDVEKIKTLWEFKIDRADVDRWALRDIRFLVYDDTDVKANGYDSDDEEGVAEPVRNDPIPAPSGSGSTCTVCSGIPEFPSNFKTRRFRLFKPADEVPGFLKEDVAVPVEICPHYLAVSHCRPPPGSAVTAFRRTCRVRNLDGTTRAARALDDVLDRAVDFANTCGLRMIWIDQECLPPRSLVEPPASALLRGSADVSDLDKSATEPPPSFSPGSLSCRVAPPPPPVAFRQISVEVMDIVYSKAIATAGLHDGVVVSQQQLDIINMLIKYDKSRGSEPLRSRFDQYWQVIQLLKAVAGDRWYTRACVAQEAVTASLGLFLVFRREPGVIGGSRMHCIKGLEEGRARLPPHSLDTQERKLSSEVVGINVLDFRTLVRTTEWVYTQVQFKAPDRRITNIIMPIVDVAKTLHPTLSDRKLSNVRNRKQAINAATALTLLKDRDCRDAHHRIAIVANMCRYEIRIDTAKARCDSARIGILSLALLNSDLSLLVPEMYACSTRTNPCTNTDCCCAMKNRGLLSPFDTHPDAICDPNPRQSPYIRPTVHKHGADPAEPGLLRLSAHTWTVDEGLGLGILRDQYLEQWHGLTTLRPTPVPLKGESIKATRRRGLLLARHFVDTPDDGFRAQARMEVLRNGGTLPRDSPLWRGLDPVGVEFKVQPDANYIESSPERRRHMAEIVFGILRHLNGLQRENPRAAGLANSIWQSLCVATVAAIATVDERLSGSLVEIIDLPDTVCEKLFVDLSDRNPFDMLQLHKDRNGGYHQTWFIERIMQQGKLWIGSYDRAFPASKKGPLEERTTTARATILQRQLRDRLLMDHILATKQELAADPSKADSLSKYNANIAKYFELSTLSSTPREADEEWARSLVSTFDVDGPCTVATPYDPVREMLPHPAVRSMSACWVVKELSPYSHMERAEEPGSASAQVEQDGCRKADKGKGVERQQSAEDDGPSKPGRPGGDFYPAVSRRYKVVDKVKGLWELMDRPWQQHSFV